ncbi:MAG: hypothetical protein C4341_04135 [Armatimonadota bacterium]
MPKPACVTKQASSYDRANKSPTEEWFANRDFGQFVRVERRPGRNEYVLADLQGPGAVVRIWSANPKGTIRFYLDGKDLPELVVPMRELLRRRSAISKARAPTCAIQFLIERGW